MFASFCYKKSVRELKVVHKKYTYKDGKKFGPYYYETKRIDGHVVTTYLGTSLPNKNKRLVKIFSLIFLAIAISFVYLFSFGITGNALLELDTAYNFGEEITGNLKLNLVEGELIPADSIISVSYGNLTKQFFLSELISDETVEGAFYAEGKSLSGNGIGYGIAGEKKEYPFLDFEIYIIEEDQDNGEALVSDGQDTGQESNAENSVEANGEIEQSDSEEGSAETEDNDGGTVITGNIVAEIAENSLSGRVSKEEPFSYELSNGETASLVTGSVKHDGNELPGNVLDIQVKNKEVKINTEYSVNSEGFGEDYVGDEKLELAIDITKFGLVADREEELIISLKHDSENILEVSEKIKIENKKEDSQLEETNVAEITPIENFTTINETEINSTQINETEVNITQLNQTAFNVSISNVSLIQFGAVLDQSVKWVKTITLDPLNENTSLIVEIPASADNITVNKITVAVNEESNDGLSDSSSFITGQVTAEFELHREGLWKKILRLLRFTGRVIAQDNPTQEVEVNLNEGDLGVEVEYYTPGPTATEETVSEYEKKVSVVSPDDVHYENVLVFTSLSDKLKVESKDSIIIEWIENETNLQIYSVNDSDSDGYIDYVEWVAPHLSEQTFNIIVIIDAAHLDKNRNFISNIYNETKELDGTWSETIQDGHYVRITFEINLTNEKDITIYPRAANGTLIENVLIEVYEFNSTNIIVTFENISENVYNKVYLTNLNGTQDTFDLRIIGGEIEFDHIIDPQAQPGGAIELKARGCNAMINSGSPNTYTSACTGTYPAACATDRISCDDGTNEDTTMNINEYSGINITVFNSSIVNCQLVNQVFLCYEWWNDISTGFTTCPLYVDANGGASPTNLGVSCPDKTANPGRSCVNVTSLETWTCGNFFGSTGTRAIARTEVLNDIEDAACTLSQDLLMFNVTYTESKAPNVFGLNSPANGSITNVRSVNISLGINDTDWINGTAGYLTAFVDTDNDFSYENIMYGPVNFTTNGTFFFNYSIPPLKYNSTQGMFLLYHFDNNTIFGDNMTSVVDYATGAFNGTPSNLNGGRERSINGLGMAYEVDNTEAILLNDHALLNSPSITGEITVVAWLNFSNNVTSDNAYRSIVSKQVNSTDRDYLVVFENASKTIAFSIGNSTVGVQINTNTVFVPNTTWYHYAVTYNRTSRNATAYVNGLVDKSSILSIDSGSLMDTNASLGIGGLAGNNNFQGLIDDVAIFNKTLTAAEILDIYRLREGTYHWRVNVSDNAGAYNVSPVYTFTVGNNVPYNGTAVILNSTLGQNKTAENLNVRTTLLDLNNHTMNVTVRWYNNSFVHLTVEFNKSYANGTTFIATLGDGNTTKGQNWKAELTIMDGMDSFTVNSSNITIINSPPNVTLIYPSNGSVTLNRTNQIFTFASSDDDGDSIVDSRINISLIASSTCADSNYNGATTYIFSSGSSLQSIGPPLNCLIDNGDYYRWSVTATDDGTNYGQFSAPFNLSVQAYLNFVMNISAVDFGNLEYLKYNDTSDNSPNPIIIINQGNVKANSTIGASSLWKSVANPSIYYTAKVDNVSTNGIFQNKTFRADLSATSYTNIPLTSSPIVLANALNYTDNFDTMEVDLNVTVPNTEGPGFKNSTITFTLVLSHEEIYVK
ncbi:LamG domain-containing protein [Candidatus Pacearchaeota archaeon]|nr:LamG domain-containing protein [Candidatus Pacearchaeota archaeon]